MAAKYNSLLSYLYDNRLVEFFSAPFRTEAPIFFREETFASQTTGASQKRRPKQKSPSVNITNKGGLRPDRKYRQKGTQTERLSRPVDHAARIAKRRAASSVSFGTQTLSTSYGHTGTQTSPISHGHAETQTSPKPISAGLNSPKKSLHGTGGFVKAGALTRFPRTLKSKKTKGFPNPGTRCYRNSALQCLLHTPATCRLLEQIHRSCDKGISKCVVCALQNLFQRYWNPADTRNEAQTIDYPELDKAILTVIPKTGHDLSGYHRNEQDDPLLFLEFLLKQMEESSTNAESVTPSTTFYVDKKQVWTCVNCHTVHDSSQYIGNTGQSAIEHSFGLNVDIQTPATGLGLEKYLETSFQETLPIRCGTPSCVQRRKNGLQDPDQERHTVIVASPDVLVIRLKRFTNAVDKHGMAVWETSYFTRNGQKVSKEEMKIVKVGDVVAFPEYLNLGAYSDGDDGLMYRLDGVSAHAGTTVSSGHYIAGVRRADGEGFALVNDRTVTDLNDHRALWSLEGFHPYVLVYSKI